MSSGLNNVATTDAYSETNTVRIGDVARANFIISNASIFYQLQMASGFGRAPVTDGWFPERFLPCSASQTCFVSLSRKCTGVRVRSAVAGSPARVSLELVPPGELSSG